MAALNFPNSPSNGDTYSANGSTFTYNGTAWEKSDPGFVTLSNNTNNRVITATGASNLNGEANLTFDGSTLNVTGSLTCDGLVVDGTFKQSNGTGVLTIQDDNNTGNANVNYVEGTDSANNQKWYIGHANTGNQDLYINNAAGGQIRFRSSNADRIIMQAAGHFVPQTNNSIDLGSSSNRWRNLYINDLQLSNEARKDGGGNDVDGTWGNYTIQEGETNLYLINNRNGKKYKFNLTEVD